MAEIPIIPNELVHTISTAHIASPLTDRYVSLINQGYGKGIDYVQRRVKPFEAIGIELEEEQILGGQEPEQFMGLTIGLRGRHPIHGRDLDTIRMTLAHGVHAAENNKLEEVLLVTPTFFTVMREELERLEADPMVGARTNSLEGFIGLSIGARIYLRAEEAKLVRGLAA